MSVDTQITGQGDPDENRDEKFDIGNSMKRGAFAGTIAANAFGQPTLKESLLIAGITAATDVVGTGIAFVIKKSARRLHKELTNPD